MSEKYKLGIISNGNSRPERCGLNGTFDFTVFAEDHGVEKPDTAIFRVALDAAGCSAQEMLHVGDSLEDDVRGASSAGLRSVWLNRDQAPENPNIKADYEITSLGELLDIL